MNIWSLGYPPGLRESSTRGLPRVYPPCPCRRAPFPGTSGERVLGCHGVCSSGFPLRVGGEARRADVPAATDTAVPSQALAPGRSVPGLISPARKNPSACDEEEGRWNSRFHLPVLLETPRLRPIERRPILPILWRFFLLNASIQCIIWRLRRLPDRSTCGHPAISVGD